MKHTPAPPPKPEDTDASVRVATEASGVAMQLLKEGARGAVLLGAARLDFALERMLKTVMHSHPGGEDNLFDTDRPLGTFSAKIALAYRLGLLDKASEHALQMIRRIRNDFAHSFGDTSLADQSQRNRLLKPLAEVRKSILWDLLHDLLLKQPSLADELRDYILLVVCLVANIERAIDLLSPANHSVAISLSQGMIGGHA